MKRIAGLRELVQRYDLFIIDQYGVLHNGTVAHAGAVDAFQRLLVEHGKRVVILSNTSRRATGVRTLLASLGFGDGFHGVVTGGEAAWVYLDARRDALATCALMTSSLEKSVVSRETNDQSVFHGLDLRVSSIDDADFLLVEGTLEICYSDRPEDVIPIDFHSTGQSNAHIEAFISQGLARGLPLLCTNPDLISIQHGGRTVHMGGKIAKEYEARGGKVVYFGKPLKEHFESCIDLVPGTKKDRVVHIGDSLHHDVLGAVDTGIDSVFIAGGIHADEVFDRGVASREDDLDYARVESLCEATGVEPTYVIPYFSW
ncbi:hypothetical protein P43SY_001958 [Pythium insidiosum]|uniref:TIGR01459 family HAD-type hydrolase n=1 Tax=Pythium insidiosum TaxID=114742 RepID=A0AAD5LT66_PYTIN|nr:hypothetical protein P43SY_001958 [Pythium insidiosum]